MISGHHHFPLTLINCLLLFPISVCLDTITPTRPLADNDTIVSSGGIFEMGFFSSSPGTTANNSRYLGIWYKNIPSSPVLWVVNRDSPLPSSSSQPALHVTPKGTMQILDRYGSTIWSLNTSSVLNATKPVIAQLLNSGNLVLREADDRDPLHYIWQSFDHPTDTLLPGMKLGWEKRSRRERYLTSWKSSSDPSSGDFTFRMHPGGSPEIFLYNGGTPVYRSGPWVGVGFSGVPEMQPGGNVMNFSLVADENEVYYMVEVVEKGVISRLVVNSTGVLQRFTWIEEKGEWNVFWYAPKDQCDEYKECGAYGVCDVNSSPVCKCMPGFEPRNPQAWELRDGSNGCRRRVEVNCREDGFVEVKGVKLPETMRTTVRYGGVGEEECREDCRRNCSCLGYTSFEMGGDSGGGCALWEGDDLVDTRQYMEGGEDIFIRLSASDLALITSMNSGSDSSKKTKKWVVGISTVLSFLLIGVTSLVIWKKKMANTRRGSDRTSACSRDHLLNDIVISSKRDRPGDGTHELEHCLFDFGTLVGATDGFSDENKLGEGGFGSVFKGVVADGREIAVKRLSRKSSQGGEEFKNEVCLIAKLQHRNLVRLLGCCVEAEEKMLVYEYMYHKSLNCILFDGKRSSLLNWGRRFDIVCGVARGLLYLHQDSRYRIIHRDLKASNILLDADLNPKISDFGMARIFGGDQMEANTNRVVGTYGYMSPEYAMDGQFSAKSDVFSFGVLVLEIISGKKNRGFFYSSAQHNLLGYAWELWREGRGVELVDESAGECPKDEVLRCLHVGLLCVQERAEDRPAMSSVLLMLGGENPVIPQPKQPGFCLGPNLTETDSSSSRPDNSSSVNQVSITVINPR